MRIRLVVCALCAAACVAATAPGAFAQPAERRLLPGVSRGTRRARSSRRSLSRRSTYSGATSAMNRMRLKKLLAEQAANPEAGPRRNYLLSMATRRSTHLKSPYWSRKNATPAGSFDWRSRKRPMRSRQKLAAWRMRRGASRGRLGLRRGRYEEAALAGGDPRGSGRYSPSRNLYLSRQRQRYFDNAEAAAPGRTGDAEADETGDEFEEF